MPPAAADMSLAPSETPADRSGRRFLVALAAATLLHLAALLFMSFQPPLPKAPALSGSALEVLILSGAEQDAEQSAKEPAAVAEVTRRAEIAEPVPKPRATPTSEPPIQVRTGQPEAGSPPAPGTFAESRVGPTPAEPGRNRTPETHEPNQHTATRSSPAAQSDEPRPPSKTLPAPAETLEAPVNALQILASRGEEIDRLTASGPDGSAARESRIRRKSVSASTRELPYASYLGAWARKVERIGNLNYPREAKNQRIFGSLLLHVALRSDGSVEQIRVLRSSGYDLLDEAAIRIVELAAPYAPFPPDIAAETDVLDIVRTWQFLRGGKLGWEE